MAVQLSTTVLLLRSRQELTPELRAMFEAQYGACEYVDVEPRTAEELEEMVEHYRAKGYFVAVALRAQALPDLVIANGSAPCIPLRPGQPLARLTSVHQGLVPLAATTTPNSIEMAWSMVDHFTIAMIEGTAESLRGFYLLTLIDWERVGTFTLLSSETTHDARITFQSNRAEGEDTILFDALIHGDEERRLPVQVRWTSKFNTALVIPQR